MKYIACLALVGCATTVDPNYVLQLQAYQDTIRAQMEVEKAKQATEQARYAAIAELAGSSDHQTKQFAMFALAVGASGATIQVSNKTIGIPAVPESQEDKALKWAAILVPPVTAITAGYYGYRLGIRQSDNQASTSISANNTFSSIARNGFDAIRDSNLSGFSAIRDVADHISPSFTLNGNGVIGNGSYSVPTTITNTTTTTTINTSTNRNCNSDGGDVTC